jgi:hypothetical protein
MDSTWLEQQQQQASGVFFARTSSRWMMDVYFNGHYPLLHLSRFDMLHGCAHGLLYMS